MARFHESTVGHVDLIAVQDSWTVIQPTRIFPATVAEQWTPFREFLDAAGNIVLPFGSWLIRSQGRILLVDTGLGGRPLSNAPKEPPALPAVMTAAGVSPEAVDFVLLTHLHFDHVGWNTVDRDGQAVPLFANARYVVQRADWEHWAGPGKGGFGSADFDAVLAPLAAAGVLDLVDGEQAITSEVTAVPTPGHTPGHVSFAIASRGERAYITGDTFHTPAQVTNTDWGIEHADTDPALAIASRRALLDRVEAEGARLVAGHFPFPGLGRLERTAGKLAWRPEG